jgi:RNA polymerase sigma factor (sigma-70 family)
VTFLRKLWKETDRKLIEWCLKGRSPAWEALIQRYKRLVYHFPNQAGLKPDDCDEVFQEVFLAVHKNLEKLLEVDLLDQWIATVAKRSTWRVVHRSRRSLDDELPEDYDVEDPDLIPEDRVQLKIQQSRVRRALEELDGRCKKLLYLLFYAYDSADYDAIAADMGMARGSVGPNRNRCLIKFKKILARWGIDQKSVSRWLTPGT